MLFFVKKQEEQCAASHSYLTGKSVKWSNTLKNSLTILNMTMCAKLRKSCLILTVHGIAESDTTEASEHAHSPYKDNLCVCV